MTLGWVLMYVVAVHRLTQLIGHDRITGRAFRWWIIKRGYRAKGNAVDDPNQWGDLAQNPALWDKQVDLDTDDGNAPEIGIGLRCWWCLTISTGVLLLVLYVAGDEGWWIVTPRWYAYTTIVLVGSTGAVIVAKIVAVLAAVEKRIGGA